MKLHPDVGRDLDDPHRYIGLGRSPACRRQDARCAAQLGQSARTSIRYRGLALGHLRQRQTILSALQDLPRAAIATDVEVLLFIDRHALPGLSIGYVDAHLLASTLLTAGSALYTRDKRLGSVAERLSLAWSPRKG